TACQSSKIPRSHACFTALSWGNPFQRPRTSAWPASTDNLTRLKPRRGTIVSKKVNNGSSQDLILVGAVISILLILFTPIPTFLLNFLTILNFALGLTILLLTLYVDKPVAFSTFPSLLLVATLYRLALNVAATRLILTNAHAGEVIGAIGAFAVQGSPVVGL